MYMYTMKVPLSPTRVATFGESGCRVRVWGLGLRVQVLGFVGQGFGFRVSGFGSRV